MTTALAPMLRLIKSSPLPVGVTSSPGKAGAINPKKKTPKNLLDPFGLTVSLGTHLKPLPFGGVSVRHGVPRPLKPHG